ncbi:unnamed protein product [Amoebophrya sp. A120]|nr:unnamed protein product [Amoebophrya sp. A120]|eukprot:GSA120T00024007001.1
MQNKIIKQKLWTVCKSEPKSIPFLSSGARYPLPFIHSGYAILSSFFSKPTFCFFGVKKNLLHVIDCVQFCSYA